MSNGQQRHNAAGADVPKTEAATRHAEQFLDRLLTIEDLRRGADTGTGRAAKPRRPRQANASGDGTDKH